jgi:hypothetical protein
MELGWTCKWIWKCVYKFAIFEYGANRNTTPMDMFKLQLNHMQKNRHTKSYKFRCIAHTHGIYIYNSHLLMEHIYGA